MYWNLMHTLFISSIEANGCNISQMRSHFDAEPQIVCSYLTTVSVGAILQVSMRIRKGA